MKFGRYKERESDTSRQRQSGETAIETDSDRDGQRQTETNRDTETVIEGRSEGLLRTSRERIRLTALHIAGTN